MSPRRRGPRPLALALDDVRNELAPETILAEVLGAWREAVGPSIAAEATPTAERGGVLTISCSAAVWAQELELMGPAIVERLNVALGGGKIDRVRCLAVPVREGSY